MQNVSEHLITFRSGYAAFYDLTNDSGTGFLAGFRSGCSNNLIAADGVLNAPDYTRMLSHGWRLRLKMGSNRARPMVPTTTPITAIMIGSIMLVVALMDVSTSRS